MSQWAICVPVWRFLYHVITNLQRIHLIIATCSLVCIHKTKMAFFDHSHLASVFQKVDNDIHPTNASKIN